MATGMVGEGEPAVTARCRSLARVYGRQPDVHHHFLAGSITIAPGDHTVPNSA
jgi:hypothetical protein